MRYYFAPMEGITGYVYRNAHRLFYPGTDKYFSPFLTPSASRKLSSREMNDILPEHNENIPVVPQLLTNNPEDFLWGVKVLKAYGYREVNLNLGCPSGTVVSKKKGAGFLAFPCELDRFLDRVFCEADGMEISIKTRLGLLSSDEFEEILPIYNRYPLKELIIHPRVRSDFYRNIPDRETFAFGLSNASCPVCYNGDIFRYDDFASVAAAFPDIHAVMMGRGAVADPALFMEIQGSPINRTEKEKTLKAFHDEILSGYCRTLSGDRNVLFKMKELWLYMGFLFPDGARYLKKIRKTQKVAEYETEVEALFKECGISETAAYQPVR